VVKDNGICGVYGVIEFVEFVFAGMSKNVDMVSPMRQFPAQIIDRPFRPSIFVIILSDKSNLHPSLP